jgi:hypothetical protein
MPNSVAAHALLGVAYFHMLDIIQFEEIDRRLDELTIYKSCEVVKTVKVKVYGPEEVGRGSAAAGGAVTAWERCHDCEEVRG